MIPIQNVEGIEAVRWDFPKDGEHYLAGKTVVRYYDLAPLSSNSGREHRLIVVPAEGYVFTLRGVQYGLECSVDKLYPHPLGVTINATIFSAEQLDRLQRAIDVLKTYGIEHATASSQIAEIPPIAHLDV